MIMENSGDIMADSKPTREGFGLELAELGKTMPNLAVVSADLEDSTRAEYFKKAFPDRHFSVGIAEQDMIGTAVGLSQNGMTVFANSFAVFLTNRAYDMIRLLVCYNNANVKLACSHAGVTVGEDGGSAQCLEDIAIMRVLPNMRVVCPVDNIETRKCTRAIAEAEGPFYMRLSRNAYPIITSESDEFTIGKANMMRDGADVTVIACGLMVSEALQAAEMLAKEGISVRVLNMHTIKPIDKEAILRAAEETGAIVTAEEHQINGGLGSAVAEVLVQNKPVPVEMVAVHDVFSFSGKPDQLIERFNLKDVNIADACKKALSRK